MSTIAKAVAAALVGFAGPILTFLASWLATSEPWNWRAFAGVIVGAAITSLSAGGLTWAVPNAKPAVAPLAAPEGLLVSAPGVVHGQHEAPELNDGEHSASMGPDTPAA